MTTRRTVRWVAVGTAAAIVAAGMTAIAVASQSKPASTTVQACADKKAGALRLAKGGCTGKEKTVTWAVQGPAGVAGPAGAPGLTGATGPAGALATTPVAVEYSATSANARTLTLPSGMALLLECGSNRIGTTNVDAYLIGADEVHGTTDRTLYNNNGVVSTSTEVIDASAQTATPSSQTTTGGTHATMQYQWVVEDANVVYTLALYLTRDTRQSRPVCEFIGALTTQGPATVTPS